MARVDVSTVAERFRLETLQKAEWTHEAHLLVAVWYVHHRGEESALAELRDGISRLNVRLGGINSDTAGYHETITRAYVLLVAKYLSACPPHLTLDERAEHLTQGPLAERRLLEAFWSREVLFSTRARREWVEPDVRPLELPEDAVPG